MDSNRWREKKAEKKYAELYFRRILKPHWQLLGKILHANANKEIILRDELLLELARITGKGDYI